MAYITQQPSKRREVGFVQFSAWPSLNLFIRYINMDYFFLASLMHVIPILLVISHDIVCQWFQNLAHHCKEYPPNPLTSDHHIILTTLIPKFHLPTHRTDCHLEYNFNYTPHVGHTDSEVPEHGWAATNAVANSMKEMGPRSQHDTLDDHFGDYNWYKVMSIGRCIPLSLSEHIPTLLCSTNLCLSSQRGSQSSGGTGGGISRV